MKCCFGISRHHYFCYIQGYYRFTIQGNHSMGGKRCELAMLNNSNAETIERLRDVWTQDANMSTNYINSPLLN